MNADCPAAKDSLREAQKWQQDADIADAAYGRPPPPTIPAPANQSIPPAPLGPLTHVDDEEGLRAADLTKGDLEIPGTNFGAVVYKRGQPPVYTVAFRGTEDWVSSDSSKGFLGNDMQVNRDQALGRNTTYFTRAQEIAQKMDIHNRQMPPPAAPPANFVGHSLGGGLASAAAVAVGGDATTFNASGLHENTIWAGKGLKGNVVALHVKGEILHNVQSTTQAPEAYGTRKIALDPPFSFGRDFVMQGAGLIFGLKGIAAAQLVRSGLLHKMPNVKGSLERAVLKARDDVAAKCGPSTAGGGGSW